MTCSFCHVDTGPLERIAALDVCSSCASEPEAALARRDIAVDWTTSMGVFSASASAAGIDATLEFTCGAQGLHHKAMKLFVDEVEVGDPIFDDRVYVRTSNKESTAQVLASEGVQSVILTFVTGMRNDRFIFSHVTLENGVLTARAIPMDGVREAVELDLRQRFAALTVHLRMSQTSKP